jgi:hypothetical protein
MHECAVRLNAMNVSMRLTSSRILRVAAIVELVSRRLSGGHRLAEVSALVHGIEIDHHERDIGYIKIVRIGVWRIVFEVAALLVVRVQGGLASLLLKLLLETD